MLRRLLTCLALVCVASRATRDDGTALAQERCKRRHRTVLERRACVHAYLERKAAVSMYSATRHAVLQRTPDAIRFDHFSTFHFFDAGRYIQAQLLLHALRLI